MSSVFSSCDFAAGWASGVLALMVGHPMDTVKVWSQTLPEKPSSMKIITYIYNNEGFKGFYKGLMFPLLTAGALNSLFFGVYGNTLRFVQDIRQVEQTMCWFKEIPYKQWHWDIFGAGCIGGVACSVVNCPVELIKIQMQTQTTQSDKMFDRMHKFQGPWECLLYQYKSAGIKGIYKGYVPLLWRDVPANGLYVLSYEKVICLSGQNRSKTHHSAIVNQMLGGAVAGIVSWATVVPFDVIKSRIQADSRTHPKYKGMWDCIIKSYTNEGLKIFFRGMVSWAVVVPLDVIKSRMQADSVSHPRYKGMVDCAVKSYHNDGARVFFRGFWLIIIRSVPVNAVTFVGYEFFISFCL